MADPVVDRLEVVEVEDDEREAAAVALRARDLAGQRLVEVAPVVQAGERVEIGELARLAKAACVVDRRPGAERELLELRPRRRAEGVAARLRVRREVAELLALARERDGEPGADRGESAGSPGP